jgi:hypothetical protein
VDAEESVAGDSAPGEAVTADNAPEIVVSTEPAELIVTDGPAAFVPLVDDLLVLQNSEDDVFMHVSSQEFYIVLAGRWYQARSLNGPWAYRPSDQLPAAFARIPGDSDQADSRVYVAGTDEAREAVLDAQVPQTAAVERGEVDIDVEYDGQPAFDPVDGTDLEYANNTGSTVIESDGLYYLVEDGVWYVATSPGGPWQVAVQRPQQVDLILPTSPVYNVKYVRIYHSTPRVVYVGYTPGYTGSYVYHDTLFYGTGWYYRPWVSPHHYYPRHSTWGFHVNYNSWSGWNFGLSWGWGPFYMSFFPGGYWHHSHHWHHRHHGYWGPRGYRSRHHRHHRYGQHRYARNDYGRDGRGQPVNDAYRSDRYQRNSNLYRDGAQRARVVNTRDKQLRASGGQAGGNRKANYAAASYDGVQKFTGNDKAANKQPGLKRAAPVRSSDLRRKADVRDANLKASRNRLLADNSGNVYRKTNRSVNGNTGRKSDRSTSGYVNQKETRSKSISQGKPPARNTKRKAAPSPQASPDRIKREATNSSIRSSSNSKSRSRTESAGVKSSRTAQNSPAKERQRPQSSPVPGASVRLTQGRPSSYRSGKQATRAISAPAQKQYRPSQGSKQQRQSMSRNGYTQTGKTARQQGTNKGSSQRYSSGLGAGKQTGGRRSQRP